MALPEQAPRIPHIPVPDLKGGLRWALTHWKPAGLALATFAGGTYLALAHDRGPQSPPQEPNKASDTFKPPEGGQQGVGGIPSSQSPDNPSVSAPAGPDKAPDSKPEIPPFDCGILSPAACATGEFIQWNVPKGPGTTETIPVTGIGFRLKKGEALKIPRDLQVAVQPVQQPHIYKGYRISAASKVDGRDFTIFGDSEPNPELGLTNVGKDLPAGTVVGTSVGSGLTVFEGYPYTHVLLGSDLETKFPEQTKGQPKVINNTPSSGPPQPGGGVTWFDVPAPKRG